MSRLALYFAQRDWIYAGITLAIIFSFTLGSFFSGYFINDPKYQLGKAYGWVLLAETISLIISFSVFGFNHSLSNCFAAFACGLQNAMATNYSGTVIRTTHLTGTITDTGALLGRMARSRSKQSDTWKLAYLLPTWGGYFIGGILGELSAQWIPIEGGPLLIPIFISGITAIWYLSDGVVKEAREQLSERIRRASWRPAKLMTNKIKDGKFEQVHNNRNVDGEDDSSQKDMVMFDAAGVVEMGNENDSTEDISTIEKSVTTADLDMSVVRKS